MTAATIETPQTQDMRDYWTRNSLPPIGHEETARLVRAWKEQHDDSAMDVLIRANVRFVIDVASEYPSRQRDFEDLVADGITGLVEAIDRFDPERGFKLISYAVWWIRQAILSGLSSNVRTVRCPVNVHANAVKVRRAIGRHMAKSPNRMSREELAAATGLDSDDLERAVVCNTPEKSLDDVMRTECHGGRQTTYLDMLVSSGPSQHEEVEQRDLAQFAATLVDRLPARERTILRARFGMDGGEPQYLEAIARRMGLARERIRQLESRALQLLKREFYVAWATGYAPPLPEDNNPQEEE